MLKFTIVFLLLLWGFYLFGWINGDVKPGMGFVFMVFGSLLMLISSKQYGNR